MPVKKTPPLLCRGRYSLTMPWSTGANVIYTCKAIRTFQDIYELGLDVYETYYKNAGFDNETDALAAFNADKAAGADIITLIADTSNPDDLAGSPFIIYVPDTYIAAYPDMSDVKYSRMVIGIDINPAPDFLDLSFLKDQLRNAVSDVIGITNAVVTEHRTPSAGAVTPEQHEVAEAARQGAILLRETDHAKVIRLTAEKVQLNDQITTLIGILEANGLWPPP